ncbi:PRKCA-binding protein-like isoform X6 [Limulus polyphemus]|uniref:PRKCA-binding protein n=1 Tax=Limulus polyphemus TaxID=6850 RepID=A0ABM1T165_LIMPO|nr:PRKCA-binding protein-like isoform X6 [Limulus polyphemus]
MTCTDLEDHYSFVFFTMMEDRMGMTVTSGSVTIPKDEDNLIGISIGGGSPYCPCLYVVQVFDNTPAEKDGALQSGDEIVGVNGISVKGRTKVEVAKLIQGLKSEVTINYNKLHADPKQGKTLDIILKKMKHRVVENMSSATADALGLSRAILCNGFGDVFASIGVKEPQPKASEAFTEFGEVHRSMEKYGIKLLKIVSPMLSDLNIYVNKAVPDTKLTFKKYVDSKFEYLSYCLKVKEMDGEEYAYQTLEEPLYRTETGNYEYRLVLRCRQDARARFAKLRSDVLVKLELLDQKHVQDIVFQLQRLVSALSNYHNDSHAVMKTANIFPIEVDLPGNTNPAVSPYQGEEEDDDDKLLEAT